MKLGGKDLDQHIKKSKEILSLKSELGQLHLLIFVSISCESCCLSVFFSQHSSFPLVSQYLGQVEFAFSTTQQGEERKKKVKEDEV